MGLGNALRIVAAKLGVEITGREKVDDLSRRVDGARDGLSRFGAALTGAALVAGIHQFVTGFSEAGSAIQDASDRLGIGTDRLQEMQYAFEQAGVRGEQTNAALTGLLQRMEQASTGAGNSAGAFRALGVRLRDSNGHMRNASDVMDDIATRMGAVEDPARRVALATQLFGGAGRRLVGVLHDGEGGLAAMRRRFQELGGGISEDGVNQADRFGDAAHDLDIALLGLKSRVAVLILPMLRQLADFASNAVAKFNAFTRHTNTLQAGLVTLGAVLATRIIPAVRALSAAQAFAMAGVLLLAVAVDDLITLFTGGHSVIGDFIDDMFGVGTAENVVRSLSEAWHGLAENIRATIDLAREAADAVGFDPHGVTSARGTRGFRGRDPGSAESQREQEPSRLDRLGTAFDRYQDRVGGGGRTSAANSRDYRSGINPSPRITARTRAEEANDAVLDANANRRGAAVVYAPKGTHNETHIHNNPRVQIHLSGVSGDERAISRAVGREVERVLAEHADANHPIPQHDGGG